MKAEVQNKALLAEMTVRGAKSKVMMAEQQSCYDQLRRLRIEQEVIGATASMQEQRLEHCSDVEVKQQRCLGNEFDILYSNHHANTSTLILNIRTYI